MITFLKEKKYCPLWILLVIILIQIGVMFFWFGKKEGVHVDEMYSLESAHYLRSDVTRLTELEGWYGAWHTTDDFKQHFTVSGEQSFWAASFRDKLYLIGEISPYKILLNIVLSATPGEYSLVFPVLLNMLFFVLTQLMLYRISISIFDDKWNALLAPFFFGFSAGAVSMVLYIRMYAMIMFFSVFAVWLYMLLLREIKVSIRTALIYITILLSTYFSYLCHQYTVLLAAALAIVYSGMQIISKKWKWGVFHIGFLTILGSGYVLQSGKWKDFFYGSEAGRARQTLTIILERTMGEWWEFLKDYWTTYMKNALGGIVILVVIVVAILMAISYRKGKEDKLWVPWKEQEKQALMLTSLTSIVFYLSLSRIAPDIVARYISYLFPIASVMIAILINHIFGDVSRKWIAGGAILIAAMMIFTNAKCCYIENLYPEIAPIWEILQEEQYQIDNIYVNSLIADNVYGRHQIYRDGYIWREGLRYYVTTPEMLREGNAPGIDECNGNAVMLWVDDDEDTYEILKDLYSLTGFNTHEKLGYTQGSKIYYLTRE